jgi:hypothetical protein
LSSYMNFAERSDKYLSCLYYKLELNTIIQRKVFKFAIIGKLLKNLQNLDTFLNSLDHATQKIFETIWI